jgi:hypothetical protein
VLLRLLLAQWAYGVTPRNPHPTSGREMKTCGHTHKGQTVSSSVQEMERTHDLLNWEAALQP